MHNCAFCKNPLMPWTEWKADDGRFYCSVFCADGGETHTPLTQDPLGGVTLQEHRYER
jgi:hypothetical protein